MPDIEAGSNHQHSSFNKNDGCLKTSVAVCTLNVAVVVVSGLLPFPWAVGQLGWVTAPLVMFFFSVVTYYTSLLLNSCSSSTGNNYTDSVHSILGGLHGTICGVIRCANCVGVATVNTKLSNASAISIKAINYFHARGRNSSCHINRNPYMIIFGVAQIMLSQIPEFDQIWWINILAFLMLLTYSSIGIGLGVAKVAETRKIHGSFTGISVTTVSGIEKTWLSFQALGIIAFSFSYSHVIIQVLDTLNLKPPPTESKTMKKAISIIVALSTIFYILWGCVGYAAMGDTVPTVFLTGVGFYNSYWLLDTANAAVVIHLAWAYQASCRPLFSFVEQTVKEHFEKTRDLEVTFFPGCNPYKFNPFQLIWRSIFVIIITVISIFMPSQTAISALLGALKFWPLTVYFPVEMYIVQKQIPKWSKKWLFFQILSFACLVISIAATVGSFAGIVSDLKGYRPFKNGR